MLALNDWLTENWFSLLQSIGIIASLLFAAHQIRLQNQTQKISNLFQLTQFHRDLWSTLFERPELQRILMKDMDITREEISESEELFLSLLILHINMAYQASKVEAIIKIETLERDVGTLLSLPIPRKVWNTYREFQNRDFVEFVEDSMVRYSGRRHAELLRHE